MCNLMSVKLSKPSPSLLLASNCKKKVLMFKEGILDTVGKRINHTAAIH